MNNPRPCLVSLITSPGRSAVAVLLVEGAEAVEQVGRLFRPASGGSLADVPCDRIAVGHLQTGESESSEQVVVCRRGPETVEVHCHGGRAAAAQIVESLTALGCRESGWQDRALDLQHDAIAAEARTALAQARTERAAAILLDQYNGALRLAVEATVGQIEAGLLSAAADVLEQLVARAPTGLHLTRPWRVVLAGRPNVGKSSLINALLGYQRAIVYEQPGTTRDAVTSVTAFDGWPVELSDTAGVRATDDELEQAAIRLAQERLLRADLVVLVTDASQPCRDEDAILPVAASAPLLVHNKCDLPSARDGGPPGLATCALTGDGIDRLVAAIGKRLVPDPPPDLAALPFTVRQTELLTDAIKSVGQGDSRRARLSLDALIGPRD